MNGGRSSSTGSGTFGAVAPALPATKESGDPLSAPPPGTQPASWDWDRLDAHLRPRLLNVGQRRFGLTAEEAEDVLQDTFEAVFTKRPRVRNMEGYLVGSFFNRCANRVEQRSRRSGHEGVLDPEFPDSFTSRRLVDGVHVRSAFRLLTPGCRHLIQAYCVLRQTLAETAAEAGCTVPTVWKRLNQCMKRMRRCLA